MKRSFLVSRRYGMRPNCLRLEDRTVPTTFTVANLNDAGAGSLRAAITSANGNAGDDTINFSATATDAMTSGDWTAIGTNLGLPPSLVSQFVSLNLSLAGSSSSKTSMSTSSLASALDALFALCDDDLTTSLTR